MRILFLHLLFLPIACLSQFVVDVQKEYCIADSTRLELIWVNHTDYVFKKVEFIDKHHAVEFISPNVVGLGDTWTFYDSEGLIELICDEAIRIRRSEDSTMEIQLENNCTYTFNVLAEADSPTFWYVSKTFILPMYFNLDNSEIREDAKPILSDLLKTMNSYPNLAFEVGVHVDERYNNELSTCLSCKRADSIRNYLVEKGIDQRRVTAKGYNDSKPKIRNAKTEEQHQQNRRVEIRIISVDFSE